MPSPRSFGSPSFDCLALPPDHPLPLRRLSLRDISLTITLAGGCSSQGARGLQRMQAQKRMQAMVLLGNRRAVPGSLPCPHCCPDTFTTVLLPEDAPSSGSEEDEAAPGQPRSASRGQERRHAGHAGAAAAAREPAEEEELVPLSAQVQARLEGLCLQLDAFAAEGPGAGEGGCATRARCALALRHLEVRDSFQPRPGGAAGGSGGSAAAAAAASAAATGWADLRRTLGYHASLHRARGPKAAMVQAVAEGVAEPGAGKCRGSVTRLAGPVWGRGG